MTSNARSPEILQTVNSFKSNGLSLKYKSCTPSGCKDVGIRKFEFVAKTQFLFVVIRKIMFPV